MSAEKRQLFAHRLGTMMDGLISQVKEAMWAEAMKMLAVEDPESTQDSEFIAEMRTDAMNPATDVGRTFDADARLGAFRTALCIEIDVLHARIDELSADSGEPKG